ncbi:MAG: ATP-binding protein [Candidatus Omnitrophica bacterium]|nr:ATP-binding protein [Candidatus Omnitrophota bacterium]
MNLRAKTVYRFLIALWAVVIFWQVLEHQRVKESARSAVIHRARDITSTLGLVIRSQRRFGGFVSKQRLESALKELVKSDNLGALVLLNAAGEVVVAAGQPVDFGTNGVPPSGVHWDKHAVTVVNLVDLGTAINQGAEGSSPTIVLPEPNPDGVRPENWPRRPPLFSRPREPATPNRLSPENSSTNAENPPELIRRPGFRPRFHRPPWMNEDEYKSLIEKAGLHGLAVVLSTDAFQAACTQDLWVRVLIGGFSIISVIGFGLAWRNLVRSSDFQMRLVRASEMNSHLREMNLAAAGLAHETRNPLNIIRGLAQMISKTFDASDPVRKKSMEITDEVDRVTAQLNEFINYSKPRELRRSPVAVSTVIGDVVRTLNSDLEDKSVKLDRVEEELTVNADQKLLRQVLFNLLMNAIQAVEPNGQIQIVTRKVNSHEAIIEVRDNGPGIPEDQRKEIFRPYFTTRAKGTGLGLAVVKQIVMLHGWDVDCAANGNKGAVFCISRLELTSPS